MEKGKIVKSVGIALPDDKVIKSLQEDENQKYLGNLEADKFLVRGVNSWTVSLLSYSAAFVSLRKSELQTIDKKTRKLFTIYEELHPRSDVDRLYIPRKEGGRRLISTDDCVELAIRGLEVYVHLSKERLIQAARGDNIGGQKLQVL